MLTILCMLCNIPQEFHNHDAVSVVSERSDRTSMPLMQSVLAGKRSNFLMQWVLEDMKDESIILTARGSQHSQKICAFIAMRAWARECVNNVISSGEVSICGRQGGNRNPCTWWNECLRREHPIGHQCLWCSQFCFEGQKIPLSWCYECMITRTSNWNSMPWMLSLLVCREQQRKT